MTKLFSMIAIALMSGVLIMSPMGPTAQAADDLSINVLMEGPSGDQPTAFKGTNPNGANGQLYKYEACHFPDGRIVAQATHRANRQTYKAAGTWELRENTVCLHWQTDGWDDGCFRPEHSRRAPNLIAMIDENNPKNVTTGTFSDKLPDFCADQIAAQ